MEIFVGHRHRLVAEMFAEVLQRHGIATRVRIGTTGLEAQEVLRAMRGGIAILDSRLPRGGPATFLPLRKSGFGSVTLVLLLEPGSSPATIAELQSGRCALIDMDVGLAGFLTAVDAALRGRCFASWQPGTTPAGDGRDRLRTLSRRERQVLQMVAEGLSSKEIAAETGLSVKTVARHRENLRHKLGRSGVAHLTRLAVRLGLVEP